MKPALLADENFPRSVIAGLREREYDVLAMAEHAPETDDRSVLALARRTSRWLLSFDGDFGELIFRYGELPPPGILYFRLHPILSGRLRRVAKVRESIGQPLQKSVFECQVDLMQMEALERRLLAEIETAEDNLRLDRLTDGRGCEVREHGQFRAKDFEEPLVV